MKIIGGASIAGLVVGGVRADDILDHLGIDERKGARIIRAYDGEAIINRYWNKDEWSWGYQANYLGGTCSCGPFLTRWGAKRGAIKELRERKEKTHREC